MATYKSLLYRAQWRRPGGVHGVRGALGDAAAMQEIIIFYDAIISITNAVGVLYSSLTRLFR
jgi:hypothetical protein